MFKKKEKKDPPGYPGDEAFKKHFAEAVQRLLIEKGLPIEETETFLSQCLSQRLQNGLPILLLRALALVTRKLREDKKMSRLELSEASGVPLRLINMLERAKKHDIEVFRIARIALALGQPPASFLQQVFDAEKWLKSGCCVAQRATKSKRHLCRFQ
jgi:hypothetical protein